MTTFSKLLSIILFGICFGLQAKKIVQETDIFWDIHYGDTRAINRWLRSDHDSNQVNQDGQSVLIKAVIQNNKFLVKKLLLRDVDVNIIDDFGQTALDYAVEQENKALILILLKKKAKVTSEYNAIKCRELSLKRSGWRLFAAVALGVLAITFISYGLVAFLYLCHPGSFVGAGIVFCGFLGMYGSIKAASRSDSAVRLVLINPLIN